MTIARLYNLNDLTVRESNKIDSELNNIINFLKGSSANNFYIQFSDTSQSPFTVCSIGSNPSIEFQASGVTKVSVNKNGSLTSHLSTGTAPFIINSTTKCTNLNVGYLDDIPTTAFNAKNVLGQFFASGLQITKLSLGTESIKLVQDADDFSLQRTSDNSNILQITELESDELITLSLPSSLNLRYSYEKEDLDLFDPVILSDIKVISETNCISFNRTGNLNNGDFIGVYIAPCPISGIIKLKQATCVQYSGTTVAQSITLYKNGVSIGSLKTTALNIVVNLPLNVDLSENDRIYIKCTTTTPGSVSFCVQLLLTW